ncbi:MAG: choice-of-anchor Q domain-containing protein, partial [Acidimicrobiales bacterium]
DSGFVVPRRGDGWHHFEVIRLGVGRFATTMVLAALVAIPVTALTAGIAGAARVDVTNCSGSATVSGSLPYELQRAKAARRLTFSVSCPATSPIELSTAIDITTDLTVIGPGASSMVVSGGGTTAAIDIGLAGALSISGLTIEDGSADLGGAIQNDGSLTMTDSTVSGSRAEQGGGLYNAGTLTLTDSTVSGNSAPSHGGSDNADLAHGGTLPDTSSGFGGGLLNFGTADVDDSTLSGNTATYAGGGILNEGSLTVSASTLSGNAVTSTTGQGGGVFDGADLLITSSTVADNRASEGGGLIDGGGSATAAATIIADSTSGDCSGSITDDGYNLADDETCGFTAANNSQSGVDPELGPLQNNGGPTETQAPGPDSPALDQIPMFTLEGGVQLCPQNDQRGVVRPQAMSCDIGAVEPVLPLAITSSGNATATTGAPFSFTVTTTGTPWPKLSKHGALPKGLTFGGEFRSALIYGTPAARSSGEVYHLTMSATFGQGSSKQVVTQAFTLTVDPDEG